LIPVSTSKADQSEAQWPGELKGFNRTNSNQVLIPMLAILSEIRTTDFLSVNWIERPKEVIQMG